MQEWKTKTVIFLPDMFLAKNIARELKASIIFPTLDGKLKADTPSESGITIIGWPGKCEVHEKFTSQDVTDLKKDYPGLYIMAHPECPPEVVEKVDFTGSTAQMLQNITSPVVQKKQVALFTECAMVEMLAATHPNVLQVCSIQRRCPHMAQNSLKTVIAALENEQFEITVPGNIRQKAEIPIRRMIAIK
jgi:quinolinate synthase